jgi:non-heme chloroperoxidase
VSFPLALIIGDGALGMMAGHKNAFDCIKAFSETDFTEDLKRFDVPTLILHGDDDQIVPIDASARRSINLVKGAKLVIYQGGDHGICSTQKDRVNQELLAFFEESVLAREKELAASGKAAAGSKS